MRYYPISTRVEVDAKNKKIVQKRGQVVDGRNNWLEKEMLHQARQMVKENGTLPRKFHLAYRTWQIFKRKCDLHDEKTGRQKYYLKHAEAKADRLMERVKSGEVDIGKITVCSSGEIQTKKLRIVTS